MSYDSYLCGFIKTRSKEKASKAISELPNSSIDDEWPFLTSSMFSITESPEYRDHIVHFAASYKDILSSWYEWESKFEAFLSKIEYNEVKLIIDDCYKGDFIVIWTMVSNVPNGGMYLKKFRRYLDYTNQPDIEFY
jgi:hypothetical protein